MRIENISAERNTASKKDEKVLQRRETLGHSVFVGSARSQRRKLRNTPSDDSLAGLKIAQVHNM